MSKDSVVTLSRFRADVSKALALRGKSLLASSNLKEQVAQLKPLEAYFIVKELGVEDALPILRHCHQEQLQAFVDLDCWNNDRPDPVELDAWLAAFASEGPESLATAFLRLDPELQIFFINAILRLYDAQDENIPEAPRSVTRATTVDGFFVMEPIPDKDREVDPLMLVDGLYRLDLGDAFSLLKSAMWELHSETEENAYQFRQGRLQDLGFPPPDVAHKIFAPPSNTPPPHRPGAAYAPDESRLPALYASALTEQNLLTRSLARIEDSQRLDAIESELVHLVNSAIVAFGSSPRDLQGATDTAVRVRDTLALGLAVLLQEEHAQIFLEGEDAAQKGADLLNIWPLREVFARGHHTVLPLSTAARALLEDPVVQRFMDAPGTEDDVSPETADRAFLRALAARWPLLGGFDSQAPDRTKAFATPRELEAAQERLDFLAKQLT